MSPNTYTSPVESIIALRFPPAATLTTWLSSPVIFSGILTVSVVLFPSCPLLFNPHVYTFPNLSIAIAWLSPAATDTIFVRFCTCTGFLADTLFPWPSCPYVLSPHAHTVPSSLSATVNFFPASICLYVASMFVWLGTFIGANLSFPNCPSELYPNPHILPSAFNTAAYPSPPEAYFESDSITLTITMFSFPVATSFTFIQVVPTFTPVTKPFSPTVAISSFSDSYWKSLSSSLSSLNTLKLYFGVICICFAPFTLTVISGSSAYDESFPIFTGTLLFVFVFTDAVPW